jgi:polyhydroxybutyrate depolymerase
MISRRRLLAGLAMAGISPVVRASTSIDPAPGDHFRTIVHEGKARGYLVHIPPGLPAGKPVPVVLGLHAFSMNGRMMRGFCCLDRLADREGFVLVHPDGDGLATFRRWNAGGLGDGADDVGFIDRLLDDLATFVPVDPKRVHATGMSNGAMMSYRLACELPGRIASIAGVAGTMPRDLEPPARAVSVLHIHGTADPIVPYGGPGQRTPKFVRIHSVDETVRVWAAANGCPATPVSESRPAEGMDGCPVVRSVYGPGRDGAEVVLVAVQGAGHVWPGVTLGSRLLGPGAPNVPANDLIWDFFRRHPLA